MERLSQLVILQGSHSPPSIYIVNSISELVPKRVAV